MSGKPAAPATQVAGIVAFAGPDAQGPSASSASHSKRFFHPYLRARTGFFRKCGTGSKTKTFDILQGWGPNPATLGELPMRQTSREVCLALVIALASSTSILAGGVRNGGIVRDVGPEAGLVWGNGNQPFVFRGEQEILVSASRAGLHKSFNRGDLWLRTEPGLVDEIGVEPYPETLCQAPSNPDVVYLATLANGIFRTADFGESWERLASLSNPYLLACAVDSADPDVVYALAGYGDDPQFPGILFKSTDGGHSFVDVGANLPTIHYATAVAVAPTSPQTIYVADASDDYSPTGALYVSSDGGLNFRALSNAPPPLGVHPHPTEDGTLLVVSLSRRLFGSRDGGETFMQIGTGLPEIFDSLAFDPTDSSRMYVAARTNGVFRSVDGGITFERLNGLGEEALRGLGATVVGATLGVEPTRVAVYVGTSLGPFRSDDNGETFQPIHSGYRGTQVNGLALDFTGRLLVATINSVGAFRSISPGVYETITDTLPPDTVLGMSDVGAAPDDSNLYFMSAHGGLPTDGLYRTVNGGGSWTRVLAGPFLGRVVIAFAPSDPNRVYVTSYVVGLYASSDRGASFDRRSSLGVGALAVDPSDANVIYVGAYADGSGIYKSTDGGSTFQQTAQRGNFYDLAVHPKNPQIVYAGEQFGSVLRSLDAGATFTRADRGLSGDRVLGLGVDPVHPSRVFVWMHGGGLFKSDDQAEQWTPVDTGETLRRGTAQAGYTALVVDPRDPEHVYLGNGSVLQVDIEP